MVDANVRKRVSSEEWQARVDLAAAFRLVAHYGWDDLIFTHISLRVPGPEHHFLINPFEMMFEEVTASALVKIDTEGRPVDETPYTVNTSGFVIHSAIHMARQDAKAIIHLHTPCGQAVSAMSEGLLPMTQVAMAARPEIGFHEFEGLANDLDERQRLVADLGSKHSLLLRNHGTLTIGDSMATAFTRMYILERACEVQVHMLAAGLDRLHRPPKGVPEKVEQQTGLETIKMVSEKLAWPALIRKLERTNPNYRT